MTAQHTPGALRAATTLACGPWKKPVAPKDRAKFIDGLAEIIDRETAAPSLLEACRRVLRAIEWADTADRMTTQEKAETLRAAIAKANTETE